VVKFDKVKLSYTCAANPPENIYIDRSYSIGKDNEGFFFTDGDYVQYVKDDELWFIEMLFTPTNVEWSEVDFKEEVEVETKPLDIKNNK